MLLNNLDAEVAEHPEQLVVYGGSGRAARSHDALKGIVRTLLRLKDDETLLVQSGKPVGVFRTHEGAPRVLIANSLLVPHWATWDEFRRLEAEGLTMFGQMTAGSWIYIGTQGILQGTYQTFAAAGEEHFGSPDLSGRTVLTAGLGGMGGAQPLAASSPERRSSASRSTLRGSSGGSRPATSTRSATSIDDGARAGARRGRRGASPLGRCARERRRRLSRARRARRARSTSSPTRPPRTIRSPATSLPRCRSRRRQRCGRATRSGTSSSRAQSIVTHVRAMVEFVRMGCYVFDYGNNLRGEAYAAGLSGGIHIPGLRPGLYPAALLPRHRAVSLGRALRRPGRHRRHRRGAAAAVPGRRAAPAVARDGARRVAFQGLPARICWLGYGDRARRGSRSTSSSGRGACSAPVVIGRDHLDSGSVASPYRETEAMRDGSDAIADWPILNALLNVAAGATWVSVHHGGGVGIGNSIHAGMVVLADGTRSCRRAARARAHRRPRHRA